MGEEGQGLPLPTGGGHQVLMIKGTYLDQR